MSPPLRMRLRKGSVQTTAISVGFLALLLMLWQVLPTMLGTPSYVLPPLFNVLAALSDPAAFPRYFDSAAVTGLSAGGARPQRGRWSRPRPGATHRRFRARAIPGDADPGR